MALLFGHRNIGGLAQAPNPFEKPGEDPMTRHRELIQWRSLKNVLYTSQTLDCDADIRRGAVARVSSGTRRIGPEALIESR